MKTINKLLVLLISLISIAMVISCNPVTSEVNYEYFYNNWTRSYEEESTKDSIIIFRPGDYKEFPKLRYREIIKFNKDKTCSFLVLGPNDGHYIQYGNWNFLDQGKNIITIIDPANIVYKKFQITELKRDVLKFIIVN